LSQNLIAALDVSLAGSEAPFASFPFVVIALEQNAPLAAAVRRIDDALGGAIERAISERYFTSQRDETYHIAGPAAGPRRVLLVGMGTPADRAPALRRAASIAARRARESGAGRMLLVAPFDDPRQVEHSTIGLFAGAWDYSDLKTPPPPEERKQPLSGAALSVPVTDAFNAGLESGRAIGIGQSLTRTLGMMPGNLCTPEFLASTANDIGRRHGLRVTVLGRAELEAEQMGSMLSVALGTPQEPKLITLEYNGGTAGSPPVALVGKGLCFDSGGISIKPADKMELMKFDMSGGGAVLGAMEAIARVRPAINVVGIIGATTNMPSGTALKPGDVVRSHSGRFIEIINTDAEGRLVLADLLSYVRRFSPSAVVDAATLTGAVVVSLGHVATGVFGTDAALVSEIIDAGKRVGEPSWELPLWEDYRELITSDVADVKNSGGRPASSITAALFLKDFAVGYPWVHLDIAGTAYSETDLTSIQKGPTGVPVCTFVEFVRARAG
jgi:leucyl aminopeptidase